MLPSLEKGGDGVTHSYMFGRRSCSTAGRTDGLERASRHLRHLTRSADNFHSWLKTFLFTDRALSVCSALETVRIDDDIDTDICDETFNKIYRHFHK